MEKLEPTPVNIVESSTQLFSTTKCVSYKKPTSTTGTHSLGIAQERDTQKSFLLQEPKKGSNGDYVSKTHRESMATFTVQFCNFSQVVVSLRFTWTDRRLTIVTYTSNIDDFNY